MDMMVNMMREHVPQETRIHYVITKGGEAPNVVPAFAEVYYYVRHPHRDDVKSIWERVVKAAEGAALGTETKMDYEVTGGVYNMLPNQSLAKVMDANLRAVGGYVYDEKEKEFAKKIQASFTGNTPKLETTNEIDQMKIGEDAGGSTDVADISWVVPTTGLGTATWVPGTSAHSWQAGGGRWYLHRIQRHDHGRQNPRADRHRSLYSPVVIEESWKELKKMRGEGFKYDAMIGDRKPALDYRK